MSDSVGLREKIGAGLERYAASVDDDVNTIKYTRFLLDDVESQLASIVKPEDRCSLAFPSFIAHAGRPQECLVAIFEDRMVIAWKAGRLFRKTVSTLVIPLNAITAVKVQKGPASDPRGPVLLEISGLPNATIALPADRADAAAAVICAAIGPAAA